MPEKASTLTVTLAGGRRWHWPQQPTSHLLAGLSYRPGLQPYLSLLFPSVLLPLFTNSEPIVMVPQPGNSAAAALILHLL